MTDKPKKKISADDRLRAFALFTMAKQHNDESNKFADGLARVLGLEDKNSLANLADAIWADEDFSKALVAEGFEVEE